MHNTSNILAWKKSISIHFFINTAQLLHFKSILPITFLRWEKFNRTRQLHFSSSLPHFSLSAMHFLRHKPRWKYIHCIQTRRIELCNHQWNTQFWASFKMLSTHSSLPMIRELFVQLSANHSYFSQWQMVNPPFLYLGCVVHLSMDQSPLFFTAYSPHSQLLWVQLGKKSPV